MTADNPLSITADMQTNRLTIRRSFDAPKALVWDCYTKADLLDQWFAPEPLTARTKFMEFREGGYWHFAMIDADGTEYWARFDYEAIDPTDSYRARDAFSDETGAVKNDMPVSVWDVTFEESAPHTFVQIVATYESAEAMQSVRGMGMEEGMKSTFNRLDRLLKTRTANAE
ncbi:MAG: SRPBCC domain-containing protein [Albidovulum sp.]